MTARSFFAFWYRPGLFFGHELMAGKLQDRVCMITGSTGIAAATARLAISEGASVFIAGNAQESGSALADPVEP